MIAKMMLFVIFFIWIRATLPRLRYDQLMAFGWKVLLPLPPSTCSSRRSSSW